MENKKPFIITIAIMSLIIICLSAFIAFNRVKAKKAEEKKTSIIDNTEIDLNAFYQISDTLNRFDEAFNPANSNYLGYIYTPKRVYASKFDKGAALYASMITDMIGINTVLYIPEGILKSNFERIFGKNLEYEPVEIVDTENYYFNYELEAQRYAYFATNKNTQYPSGYVPINIKTVLEGDSIILTRKIFYGEYVETDGVISKIAMYKDSSKQKKIGEVKLKNGVINKSEIIAKYSSKLTTYKYIFKQNKGADYSFYEIEKGK